MAYKIRYLFGRKPCLELVQKNPKAIKILHVKNLDDYSNGLLKKQQISVQLHNHDSFFMQFKSNLNHQNFVAELQGNSQFLNLINFDFLKKSVQLLKKHSIVLVLDEIMDVQNFGAILRTAYATNVSAVIFKKDNQAQVNDFIVKTSMGFIHKIPLLPVVNLTNTICKLKKLGYWIYASCVKPQQSVPFQTLKYNTPTALVIGNENKGVSKLVLQNADFLIQIPMWNEVESLNASVACGILLYGIVLQKQQDETKPVNCLN